MNDNLRIALLSLLILVFPGQAAAAPSLFSCFLSRLNASAQQSQSTARTATNQVSSSTLEAPAPTPDIHKIQIRYSAIKGANIKIKHLLDKDGYLYIFRLQKGKPSTLGNNSAGAWGRVNGYTSHSLSPFIDKEWRMHAPDLYMVVSREKLTDKTETLFGAAKYSSHTTRKIGSDPHPMHFVVGPETNVESFGSWSEINTLPNAAPNEFIALPLPQYREMRDQYTTLVRGKDYVHARDFVEDPKELDYSNLISDLSRLFFR